MGLVSIGERVLAGPGIGAFVAKLRVLHQQRCRIDADAGRASVEPEAQHVLVLRPDVGVRPVQVRLLRREEVQVPLAVGDAGPGVAAEDRLPLVRRLVAVGAASGSEPEARALGGARQRGERRPEPRVLLGNVVRNDVDDRPDAERTRVGDQTFRLREGAEGGVDRSVVRDVVPVVRAGRRIPGVEPEPFDPEVA